MIGVTKILFQGDSITFAWRNYDDPVDMGQGFPNMIAGRLGLDAPDQYEFCNRGVNGSRVVGIYTRIKKDIINEKPDWVSILIGINDSWLEFTEQAGVDAARYKKIYKMLIDEVLEALPNTRFILLEPFVLNGSMTSGFYGLLREQMKLKSKSVQELAEEYHFPFVALQEDLDRMAENVSDEYYLYDGIHPSLAFHQFIADKWIEVFKKYE